MEDERQGIVHIIGPEQGFTLPGTTCVCGDSHTATHGAFGALAFGIGTSEVEHVLATMVDPIRQALGAQLPTLEARSHTSHIRLFLNLVLNAVPNNGNKLTLIEPAQSVERLRDTLTCDLNPLQRLVRWRSGRVLHSLASFF